MRTLTAERTMGSGYTRGRLPYFQLRYSWRLRASGMWRRVPCYRKTRRHSPPNQQTFSVTAELIRNLAFVGFVYPNRRQLDNRKILCLWNDIQFQLRAKSLVHKQRRNSWIVFFCVYFQREKTQLLEHYAFIWHRLHDGQKRPKHATDDKWLYSVLRIVFALEINTDID